MCSLVKYCTGPVMSAKEDMDFLTSKRLTQSRSPRLTSMLSLASTRVRQHIHVSKNFSTRSPSSWVQTQKCALSAKTIPCWRFKKLEVGSSINQARSSWPLKRQTSGLLSCDHRREDQKFEERRKHCYSKMGPRRRMQSSTLSSSQPGCRIVPSFLRSGFDDPLTRR